MQNFRVFMEQRDQQEFHCSALSAAEAAEKMSELHPNLKVISVETGDDWKLVAGRCEGCNRYLFDGDEYRYDGTDGIVLCRKCQDNEPKKG